MSTKILVIDDNPPVRQFIARSLRQHLAGCEVITADDGEQGLALARTEAPGVILLDLILPRMKGDEVCRELAASAATRGIPVVLMSGRSGDLDRTAQECGNVVKTISKPFTLELLCATIGGVMRDLAERPAPLPGASCHAGSATACLSGHTGNFSLHSVLLAIERDGETGVLRVFTGPQPILLYVQNGRPLVATTKDVRTYAGDGFECIEEAARKEQAASGCPAPLTALARGRIEQEDALAELRLCGARLFASAWTSERARFEFECLKALPSWLSGVESHAGPMSEWALESLREVREERRPSHVPHDDTGIPMYTRRGYERIQQIRVNAEERAVASLVDNHRSVAEIVAQLGVARESVETILFRFMCLEIFDHWPAHVLRQI